MANIIESIQDFGESVLSTAKKAGSKVKEFGEESGITDAAKWVNDNLTIHGNIKKAAKAVNDVIEEDVTHANDLKREAAATLPMSEEDIANLDEIERLKQEKSKAQFANLGFGRFSDKNNPLTVTPREIDAKIEEVKDRMPDYMKGDENTIEDIQSSIVSAWSKNTEHGREVTAKFEEYQKKLEDYYKGQFRKSKEAKDIITRYRNGSISSKKADELIKATFESMYGPELEERMSKAKQTYIDAAIEDNKDYYEGAKRRMENKGATNSISDVEKEYNEVYDKYYGANLNPWSNLYAPTPSAGTTVGVNKANLDPYMHATQNLILEAKSTMNQVYADKYEAGDFSKNVAYKLGSILESTATFGLSNLEDATTLNNIFKKISAAATREGISNAEAESIYNNPSSILTDKEMLVYNAYCAKSAAQIARAKDAGLSADVANLTAEMIPFIVEVGAQTALFKGINEAASKGIAKGLARKIVTQMPRTSLGRKAAVAGTKLTLNMADLGLRAGESAVMAAVLPRTYANMLNEQTKVADGDGAITITGDRLYINNMDTQTTANAFLGAWGNQWKELFTETGGSFEAVRKMLYGSSIAKTTMRMLGKTKFGHVIDAFSTGKFFDYAKNLGYHGTYKEWTEEVEGALYDYISGDKDSFKNFFGAKNQMAMLISFSLPTVVGGGVNIAQEAKYRAAYDEATRNVDRLLKKYNLGLEDLKKIQTTLYGTDTENVQEEIMRIAGETVGIPDLLTAYKRFEYLELMDSKGVEMTPEQAEEYATLANKVFVSGATGVLGDALNLADNLAKMTMSELTLSTIDRDVAHERSKAVESVRSYIRNKIDSDNVRNIEESPEDKNEPEAQSTVVTNGEPIIADVTLTDKDGHQTTENIRFASKEYTLNGDGSIHADSDKYRIVDSNGMIVKGEAKERYLEALNDALRAQTAKARQVEEEKAEAQRLEEEEKKQKETAEGQRKEAIKQAVDSIQGSKKTTAQRVALDITKQGNNVAMERAMDAVKEAVEKRAWLPVRREAGKISSQQYYDDMDEANDLIEEYKQVVGQFIGEDAVKTLESAIKEKEGDMLAVIAKDEQLRKNSRKDKNNLQESEKNSTFAPEPEEDNQRIVVNITQNAGEDNAQNRSVYPLNETDRTQYKAALEALRRESLSETERAEAEEVIRSIQEKRRAQMYAVVEEALRGVEGITLAGISEGTGVYIENGEVIEYTSEVQLNVAKGKEEVAKSIMAVVAEELKQNSYILTDEEDSFKTTDELEEARKNGDNRDYADYAEIEFEKELSPSQVAVITKAFIDKGLGCTIVGKKLTSFNFSDLDIEEFYNFVEQTLGIDYGNAETKLSTDRRSTQATKNSGVPSAFGAIASERRGMLTNDFVQAKHEKINEKTIYLDRDGNRTETERYYGEQYHSRTESGEENKDDDIPIQGTSITPSDLKSRIQTTLVSTEAEMTASDYVAPEIEETPAESVVEEQAPEPEPAAEAIDLRDKNILIVQGPSKQGWAVVRVTTDEEGKTDVEVLTSIASNGRLPKSIIGYNGVKEGDRGAWNPVDKESKMVYIQNGTDAEGNTIYTPYYLLSKDEITVDDKGNIKTNVPPSEGRNAVRADAFTGVVEKPRGLYAKVGDGYKPLHTKVERKIPQSAKTILEMPVFSNSVVNISLAQLLGSEWNTDDNPIVKVRQYLYDKLGAVDKKEKDNITHELQSNIKAILEGWNAFVRDASLSTLEETQMKSLTPEMRELARYVRFVLLSKESDLVDSGSLVINTDTNMNRLTNKDPKAKNPLLQLALALNIAHHLGYANEAVDIKMPDIPHKPFVTRSQIRMMRQRYYDLRDGKVTPNYEVYTNGAREEMTAIAKAYPEIFDKPEKDKNRLAYTKEQQDNIAKLRDEQGRNQAPEVQPVVVEVEKEDIDVDDIDVLREKLLGLYKRLPEASAEERDKIIEQITDIAKDNSELNAEVVAQVQSASPAEAPAQSQPVVEPKTSDNAEPEAETEEEPAAASANVFDGMIAELRDLVRRSRLGDQSVTPALINEKSNDAMDYIIDNGDTSEMWDRYNDAMSGNGAEFSISDERPEDSRASRLVARGLAQVLSRVPGVKLHILNSHDEVENTLESKERIEYLQYPDGTIYGWAIGSDIYLTPEGMNAETPIHEYTHLWVKSLQATNPQAWTKVVNLLKKNKGLWDAVKNDPNYQNLDTDDAIASEVLSRFSGKEGAKRLLELAHQLYGKDGEVNDKLANTFVNRVKKALNLFWEDVVRFVWNLFGNYDDAKLNRIISTDNLSGLADMILRDLFDGKALDLRDADIEKEMDDIKAEAIKNGTFMKAPNGNPSNLSERLWLMTRTQNFKRWFGDWENDPENASKILDENGEPLVVYHGSPKAGFDIFKYGHGYSRAIFTTENRAAAAGYSELGSDGYGNDIPMDAQDVVIGADPHNAIYSLFVNLRKPMIIDFADEEGNPRHWSDYPTGRWICDLRQYGLEYKVFDTAEEAQAYADEYGIIPADNELEPETKTTDDFVREAKELGFDGCIFKNVYDGSYRFGEGMTDYVAFAPNQLKTTGNRGYFSTEDARIEFSYSIEEIRHSDEDTERRRSPQRVNAGISRIAGSTKASDEQLLLSASDFVTKAFDMTHGMRAILISINVWRRMRGLPKLEGKYDIRTAFESTQSRISNKVVYLKYHQKKRLDDAIRALLKVVEKSEFFEMNCQEVDATINPDGTENPPTELTPAQFIERYLMARNNIERMKEGNARGIDEFKQRMGMSPKEFVDAFHEAYASTEKGEKMIVELWDAIKAMTDFALDTNYGGGLISEELRDTLKAKKFYIPQRGFWADENTEDEVRVDNLGRRGKAKNKLDSMHKAEGGKSLAAGGLAYIYRDAEEAIKMSEENKAKIVLFNLLRDNPEWCSAVGFDIPREISYYTKEDGTIGVLQDDFTKEEIDAMREEMRVIKESIVKLRGQLADTIDEEERNDILAEIEEQQASMPYFDEKDTKRIMLSYLADSYDTKEHKWKAKKGYEGIIPVYINGVLQQVNMPKSMLLTADAYNGRRDKRGEFEIMKKAGAVMSAIFTMKNIGFAPINIVRDTPFVIAKGGVEYGPEFQLRFAKNFVTSKRAVFRYLLRHEYLDSDTGEMLRDFMDFGANTGFFTQPELQDYRRRVEHALSWKEAGKQVVEWATLAPVAEVMNEYSELITRFSIYRSIVEMGLGREEATKAAQNLSVNFNRKGLGQPFFNFFNSMTVFSNATIQGALGGWRTFYKDGDAKEKTVQVISAFTQLMLVPAFLGFLNTLLVPDDDDEEFELSQYTRDNYIIFSPDFKVHLNEFMRPAWVIGVNAAMLMRGKRTPKEACLSVMNSALTHWLPMPQNLQNSINELIASVIEGRAPWRAATQAFSPTPLQQVGQLAENKNFMGGKLRYDLGYMPEYMMADKESALFKDLSYLWYSVCGGNKLVPTTEKEDGSRMSELANTNPKQIRSLLTIVPKGQLDLTCLMYALGKDVYERITDQYDGTNVRVSDIPVITSFYKPYDNMLYRYGVMRQAREIAKNHKDAKKHYEEAITHFGDILSSETATEKEKAAAKKSYEEAERLLIRAESDVPAEIIEELMSIRGEADMEKLAREFMETRNQFQRLHKDIDYESVDNIDKGLIRELLININLHNGLQPDRENPKLIDWFDNHIRKPVQEWRERDEESDE